MSDPTLVSTVKKYSALAGDATPTNMRAVSVTRAGAIATMNGVYPTSGAPQAETDWLNGPADVVQMDGQFTDRYARLPKDEPAPTGTQLTVALDARSGRVIAVHLGGTSTPNLVAAGTVRALQ